ncbi:hypothetical protein Syun_003591 [Stephania yunnanensis]|uniref:Beta-ketoacyl synthase C-terminal domain-containing protein n=1 Tax=Stephania yunnanensis TaxID=152371 RepID=A0AAP0L5D6_9MAGN
METIWWEMVYCLSLTSAHLTLSIFIASPRQQAVTDDHPRRRRPPSSSLSLLTTTRRTGVVVQSGVSREDVNYINAHATSTQAGDIKGSQSRAKGELYKINDWPSTWSCCSLFPKSATALYSFRHPILFVELNDPCEAITNTIGMHPMAGTLKIKKFFASSLWRS